MKDDNMGGLYNTHEIDMKCIKDFLGKPEGKGPQQIWENNVNIYFEEIECGDLG
jgi:hypothetical protein